MALAWLLVLAAPAAAISQEHGGATAAQAASGEHGEQPPAGEGAHAAQPAEAGHAAQTHEQPGEGGEHGEGGHEAESPWALIGKIFNFALLAGGLVYLLRSPFADYLRNRGVTIRSDLAKAREMREEASAQMAKIEERLKSLPAEIEALKQRGAAEIAAEQARMREATEAERQRMLEQARREVDTQVRNAQRMLLKRAGELAVGVATERVRRTITDADQSRLVDRYVSQVGARG